MRRIATLLLIGVLLSYCSVLCFAQSKQSSTQGEAAGALRDFDVAQARRSTPENLQLLGPSAFPCETETNESVKNACLTARSQYYVYYAKGLSRRTAVYEWNNISTHVIFVVVLILVGIGVYFSWRQFTSTSTIVPTNTDKPGDAYVVTEFEASLQGIRVRSPVLGVILLTISLAFFYLYLRYVYPVTEHF